MQDTASTLPATSPALCTHPAQLALAMVLYVAVAPVRGCRYAVLKPRVLLLLLLLGKPTHSTLVGARTPSLCPSLRFGTLSASGPSGTCSPRCGGIWPLSVCSYKVLNRDRPFAKGAEQ